MDKEEWERTRKALQAELVAKAFELCQHVGGAQNFILTIRNTKPPLYLCLGEADQIRRNLPHTNTGFDSIV